MELRFRRDQCFANRQKFTGSQGFDEELDYIGRRGPAYDHRVHRENRGFTRT